MSRWLSIMSIALVISCRVSPDIEAILSSEYEVKMISSGKNRPAIDLWKNDLKEILILLHHRVPMEDIQEHFGWSAQETQRRLQLLRENDFIKESAHGTLVPTSMIITLAEGEQLYASASGVASRIADYLEQKQGEIRAAFTEMSAFAVGTPDPSFLIMSDVILDNWQINNIEREFIKAERTARHGVHYYHSVQEKLPESDLEAFGIYGNQMWGGGSFMAGVYGNRRSSTKNLNSLRKKDLVALFGMKEDADQNAFKQSVLEEIVAYYDDASHGLPEGIRNGLDSLGLLVDGKLRLFVLTGKQYAELSQLAGTYTRDLVAVLEDARPMLHQAYETSRYVEEITFEEYLIWWYHFLYTEATNELADRGVIMIPDHGITTYVVDGGEE